MAKKYRVCRLYGQRDLRVEDAMVPELKDGEVLVRLARAGICGSDLHYYHDGGFGPVQVCEPIILGHEASGFVEAAADDGASLLGQPVALNPSRPCGYCRFCGENLAQHCLNMRFNGSAMRLPHEHGFFRDLMAVPAAQCVPLPPQISMAAAACAEPLAVCLHATAQAPPLSGKNVLVTGSGPVGLLCVALAQLSGAKHIVATDLYDVPLRIARVMGAHDTVNVTKNPYGLVAFEQDKGQFDVAFECSAAEPALTSGIRCTRPQGTIVQVAVTGSLPIPVGLVVSKEVKLIGTHRFHREFEEAVRLIVDGSVDLEPIITDTFSILEADAAIAAASDRSRSVKVQISS